MSDTTKGDRPQGSVPPLDKPPADRLYGRVRGHALRPRQQQLLDEALPRLRVDPAQAHDPHRLFATAPQRLALEIGYGGGEHAASLAAQHPDQGLIACEVFENGICSLLSRLIPDTADPRTIPLPANLRLWDDDARILMRELPDASLDLVVLMFPDPWPKARHAKRRFVHPGQIPIVARLLRPGGTWRIASDDPTYQAWVTDTMAAQTLFHPESPTVDRPEGWPPTRYEAKALRAGRTPRYWSFTRADTPATTGGEPGPEREWTKATPERA